MNGMNIKMSISAVTKSGKAFVSAEMVNREGCNIAEANSHVGTVSASGKLIIDAVVKSGEVCISAEVVRRKCVSVSGFCAVTVSGEVRIMGMGL